MHKKPLAIVLMLLTLLSTAHAEEYIPLPAPLQITQTTKKTALSDNYTEYRLYPNTVHASINEALRTMVDTMADNAQKSTDALDKGDTVTLVTGASIAVTGTKTASFLMLSRVGARLKKQTYIDFDTRVYDMETGMETALNDYLNFDDANTLSFLQREIVSQLTAYFPTEAPNQAMLSALSTQDAILATRFLLTPAYLKLVYRADMLYEDKNTLMFVQIPYLSIHALLTPLGAQETDNSMYKTAALTFDDGPALGVTLKMLLALMEGGAPGTFFNIGTRLEDCQDLVAWEHDAGYAVESHTLNHDYADTAREAIHAQKETFAQIQEGVIGIAPRIMRAPGGKDTPYVNHEIGLPIFRWNCLTGDAQAGINVYACTRKCMSLLKPHSNILMHNIRHRSVTLAQNIIRELRERGYLFVTAQEQILIGGILPQENMVYYGNERAPLPGNDNAQ